VRYYRHFVSVVRYLITLVYFSQTSGSVERKLGRNITWVVLNILYDFHFIQKFGMAGRANYAFWLA